MSKQVLLAAVLSASACCTVHYTPNAQRPNEQGVRVLYEYPQEVEFKKSLEVIDVNQRPEWCSANPASQAPAYPA